MSKKHETMFLCGWSKGHCIRSTKYQRPDTSTVDWRKVKIHVKWEIESSKWQCCPARANDRIVKLYALLVACFLSRLHNYAWKVENVNIQMRIQHSMLCNVIRHKMERTERRKKKKERHKYWVRPVSVQTRWKKRNASRTIWFDACTSTMSSQCVAHTPNRRPFSERAQQIRIEKY